jgi:hypothetical protein
MPMGEFIGELILRPVIELVVWVFSYWTGFVFLKGITLGRIRLDPVTRLMEEDRRSNKKWHQIDWSLTLRRPTQPRALRAEWTCLVGLLVWAAVGVGIYFCVREDKEISANETSLVTPVQRQSQSSTFHDPQLKSHESEKGGPLLVELLLSFEGAQFSGSPAILLYGIQGEWHLLKGFAPKKAVFRGI